MRINRGIGPAAERHLDHQVMVRNGREAYRTDISVRSHTIVVDEPEVLGGMDLGPTPYDMLCGALGACTAITVRMYADRKGWPLEAVTVHVELTCPCHENGDMHGREAEVFLVQLEFEGELEEEQRARLTEIGEGSIMHRSLAAGAVIETRRAMTPGPV